MTEAKTNTPGHDKPQSADAQKPGDVTISQGLGKLFEAGEELTEEQTDAMAEQAKAAAKKSQAERDNKNEQIASGKDK
ncbi:hypothetical protein [Acerihabitans arboris]|uniref:Uncharacterized protein n=1 Tax=Acerihabitans arboris TaxID=2691583 RepID=A0A845SM54_9GAMM|nr:hypothetical protein [Acerihabitans arboris]NDL64044.1 hypothetical protein [Acerihabitans arboris]